MNEPPFADALKAYQNGDLGLAESLTGHLLDTQPDHVEALILQGLLYARTKRRPEAIQCLAR
ncbi:MAG TPA: hypothetical protein VK934_07690, partial [Fimbriimonas sp.]|nr:hypothetical protein [Fimbriimonas sp.]